MKKIFKEPWAVLSATHDELVRELIENCNAYTEDEYNAFVNMAQSARRSVYKSMAQEIRRHIPEDVVNLGWNGVYVETAVPDFGHRLIPVSVDAATLIVNPEWRFSVAFYVAVCPQGDIDRVMRHHRKRRVPALFDYAAGFTLCIDVNDPTQTLWDTHFGDGDRTFHPDFKGKRPEKRAVANRNISDQLYVDDKILRNKEFTATVEDVFRRHFSELKDLHIKDSIISYIAEQAIEFKRKPDNDDSVGSMYPLIYSVLTNEFADTDIYVPRGVSRYTRNEHAGFCKAISMTPIELPNEFYVEFRRDMERQDVIELIRKHFIDVTIESIWDYEIVKGRDFMVSPRILFDNPLYSRDYAARIIAEARKLTKSMCIKESDV